MRGPSVHWSRSFSSPHLNGTSVPRVAVGGMDGAREWGGGRYLAGCLEDVRVILNLNL